MAKLTNVIKKIDLNCQIFVSDKNTRLTHLIYFLFKTPYDINPKIIFFLLYRFLSQDKREKFVCLFVVFLF